MSNIHRRMVHPIEDYGLSLENDQIYCKNFLVYIANLIGGGVVCNGIYKSN